MGENLIPAASTSRQIRRGNIEGKHKGTEKIAQPESSQHDHLEADNHLRRSSRKTRRPSRDFP